MKSHRTLAIAITVCVVACSPGSHSGFVGENRTNEATRSEEYLGLEQPEHGFQVRSLGVPIEPGADIEYCEIAELPGDPSEKYYVDTIEFANAPMSHHLIVTASKPGSASDRALRDFDVGDRMPCLGAQIAFGQDGMEDVGGIQQQYGKAEFPPGIQ